MYSKLFHNPMDSLSGKMRLIEMIDPICHSSISQDMRKTFIILFDQFCDFPIFPFLLWNDSMFPFIERSPCNSKLFAHPVDAPAVVCIEVFNCQILWFVALFSQPHIPSNSFTFFNSSTTSSSVLSRPRLSVRPVSPAVSFFLPKNTLDYKKHHRVRLYPYNHDCVQYNR